MAKDWSLQADAEGNDYFYNAVTFENSWTAPDGFPAERAWVAKVDEESSATYYLNMVSGESSWEVPAGFAAAAAAAAAASSPPPAAAAEARPITPGDPSSDDSSDVDLGAAAAVAPPPAAAPGAAAAATPEPAATATAAADVVTDTPAADVPAADADAPPAGWTKVIDEEAECEYYVNETTGETSWEMPEGVPHAPALTLDATSSMAQAEKLRSIMRSAKMSPEMRRKFKEAKKAHSAQAKTPWVEVYDPTEEAFYYWHETTGDVQWEAPADYRMAADDVTMSAVIKMQSLWRAKHAKEYCAVKVEEAKKVASAGDWVEVFDEAAGATYYYNEKTGEALWEPPEHVDSETIKKQVAAEDDLAKAEKLRSILRSARMPPGMRAKFAEAKKKQSAASTSPWVEVYDPDNEAYYYWHNETQEVTWEAPSDYRMAADDATMAAAIKLQCLWRARQAQKKVDGLPHNWVLVTDAEAGCEYYLNELTGETAWELPEELRDANTSGTLRRASLDGNTSMADAEKMRSIMRKAKMPPAMRAKFDALKRARSMESDSPWVEVYDPDMGAFYYHNGVTGDVDWTAPSDYRMAADDATMAAVIKLQCVWRGRRTARKMGDILAGRGGARGAHLDKVKAALAEHDTEAAAAFAAQAETGGVWVEAFDPTSGNMYYHHTGTSETSWEKPAVYCMAADNALMSATIKVQNLFRGRKARETREELLAWTDAGKSTHEYFTARDAMRDDQSDFSAYGANAGAAEIIRRSEEEEKINRELAAMREKRAAERAAAREEAKRVAELERQAAIAEALRLEREAEEERLRHIFEAREAERLRIEAEYLRKKTQKSSLLAEFAEEAEKARAELALKRERDEAARIARMEAAIAKYEREAIEKASSAAAERKQLYSRAKVELAKSLQERDAALRQLGERRTVTAQRAAARVAAQAERRAMGFAAMASPFDAAGSALCPAARQSELLAAAEEAETAHLVATGRLKQLRDSGAGAAGAHDMVNEATGEGLLHAAAGAGNAEQARLLIDMGCDVNRYDSVCNKCTPLHEAARAGWAEIASMLIAAGASIDAVDSSGDLPLHVAARADQRWAMEVLLDADARRWTGVDAGRPATAEVAAAPVAEVAAEGPATGAGSDARVGDDAGGAASTEASKVVEAAPAPARPDTSKKAKRAAARKAKREEATFTARLPTLTLPNGKGRTAKELATRWRTIRVVRKFVSAPYWQRLEAEWAQYGYA